MLEQTTKLQKDPDYLGIREPRLDGKEYFDMVDEFMQAVFMRWPNVVVQFEDFRLPRRFLCWPSIGTAIAVSTMISKARVL